MAYIDTENIPLHMPVPGTREPAQIALLNENCVALSLHDHTDGKALAIGRLRSGLEANRPAAGSAGNVYFSTDTGRFWADTGTAWVGFITEGGQATVTGWTLIDPVIRDALQFGPEGSATIDNNITRTGANALRTDSALGVGVAPKAWGTTAGRRGFQVGMAGSVAGDITFPSLVLSSNMWADNAGVQKYIVATDASPNTRVSFLSLAYGGMGLYTGPGGAADANVTAFKRFEVTWDGHVLLNGDLPGALTPTTGNAMTGVIVGKGTGLFGDLGPQTLLTNNSFIGTDGSWHPSVSGTVGASWVYLTGGNVKFSFAPAIGLGGTQVFVERFNMDNFGQIIIRPVPASFYHALQWEPGVGFGRLATAPAGIGGLSSMPELYSSQYMGVEAASGYWLCRRDGGVTLGSGSHRFATIYLTAAPVVGSSADLKEDFAALDQTACVQAVLETDWISFTYKEVSLPEPLTRPEGVSDEEWDERERMASELEAESALNRQQKGYVLGHPEYRVSDLFGTADRKNRSDGADLAVVACALQSALNDIAALKEQVNALSA